MNRRNFLNSTLAMTAGIAMPVYASYPQHNKLTKPGTVTISDFIHEAGHAESTEIAEIASRAGVTTHAVKDELGMLWYQHLSRLWDKAPVPIAGITRHETLFFLERLAWSHTHQLRLAFKGVHNLRTGANSIHTLTGPSAVVELVQNMSLNDQGHGRNWIQIMGQLLLSCHSTTGRADNITLTVESADPVTGDAELVSWVLAPRTVSKTKIWS